VRFLTDRYGDFVLYRPPLRATTLLLWIGPFALLGYGGYVLWRQARRRSTAPESAPTALSADERSRLEQLKDKLQG